MGVTQVSIAIGRFSGLWGISCWEIRFLTWLVRVFICPQVGRSWVDVTKGGAFWRSLEPPWPYWNFFILGFLLFSLHFECRGPPWVKFSEEKVCWVHLGKYKHIPFPVRLISQISIVYWTHLGPKWAEEEKSPSIPWNLFLLKYFPVVGLKNLKQIELY